MKITKYTALAAVACFMVSSSSAGVVALYTFDDATSLGANSGTAPLVWKVKSGVTATNGMFGGAGSFVAGVSSYWQNRFSLASTDLGEFSVSMHVRGTGAAERDYFSIGTGTSSLLLEQTDAGSVAAFSIGDTGEKVVNIEGTSIVNDGNWHHLGLVSDGTNITLYIDGVAEGTPSAYTSRGTISRLQLASRLRDGHRQITADLDDVGIFDAALTPAEMAFFSSHAIPEPDTLSVAGGFAAAEPVDPCFPSELRPIPLEEWTRWPRARIRQLEIERNQLLKKISLFPQHRPIYVSTQLGYHSRFEEAGSAAALPPHRILITWPWYPLVDSIALVPAFNPKQPEIYAFPKRFKIEVLTYEGDKFETVVDWMDEDFPDPGLYPVFFAGINRLVTQVRITVPQVVRESGMAYSALGEVYVLEQRPDGSTGANMVTWSRCRVEAPGSLSMPPLWDIEYLYDGLVGLGYPLSDETVDSKDLRVVFEDKDPPDEVQLLLDLGRVQKIGLIDFWPASPPAGLVLPPFGFPGDISVELSADPDFQTVKVITVKSGDGNMPRENLYSVAARGYRARYLRVTIKELGEYNGKRILELGEIWVSQYGQALSINCKVSAQGIPEESLDQLPRLVDGCSWQRRILSPGEWVKGLAQRRPLDRRLAVVERELELARASWRKIQLRLIIWGSSFMVAGLIGWVMVQRGLRKRGIDKLKWRITRDLHDDVGSNLGSIALTAEKLKHADMNAEVRQAVNDLTLLAREAFSSLREVVWVVNESTIHLSMLIQKLGERVEKVLGAERVVVELPPVCPDQIVPLTIKRHLVMLFKEMVHNCARHAHANRIRVDFSVNDESLRISVRDDGRGFDTAAPSDGWGLVSMEERAHEIGGTLNVESQVGEGTTVVLTVPLTSLTSEAEHLYKTSN